MERKEMGKLVCILLLTYLCMVTSVTVKLHLNPRCWSMIWASIFALQRLSTTVFDGKMKLPVWSNTRLGQAKEGRGFAEILPCRCWEAVTLSAPRLPAKEQDSQLGSVAGDFPGFGCVAVSGSITPCWARPVLLTQPYCSLCSCWLVQSQLKHPSMGLAGTL